jgi:hypothetical protein
MFCRQKWQKIELERWYQLDFDNRSTQQLLVQAEWFAGTFENPTSLREDMHDQYDHWHWETFLQRRELVPVTEAAAQLAMSVTDFREVADRFVTSPGVSAVGNPWANGSNCIVRKSFLRDFHKGFEGTRRVVFGNYPSYIQRIHEQIIGHLNYTPTRTNDESDVALGDTPPGPGYSIDCITQESVGMGRDVFLDTGKPIQLRPDCCSWLTFARFEDILKPKALGSHERLSEEILLRLKNYDAR